MKHLLIIVFSLFIYASTHAQADLSYFLPQNVTYNPDIPTPKSFLGYQVGEWHVGHDQLLYYMRALAAASDRIEIESHGRTYEGRPLVQLIITHPENHANLENIRREHLSLSDPSIAYDAEINVMPGVLWMGYSIHGNEASGSNAALAVAYYLAAAEGSEIEQQLREMVIIFDPSYNPDGLNRFASWVNTHRGIYQISDDANDREHNEAWPRGRTNHYWFDLNRDWLPVQHPESRGRIEKFHRWKPNWLTDHHEMGTNSTFFFQPGVPSRNHPLTPPKVFELTQKVAQYHAEALDAIGSLYYTKEGFDDFYYGKGSTYPDVNGSVGILFEQASSRGHRQQSANGPMTFPFAIRNQVTTSLSTLKGTHAIKNELLGHQREFFASALDLAGKDPVKAIVFGSSKDPARAWHLADLIRRHDIDIYTLDHEIQYKGKALPPKGNYIIPLGQAQYRLIKSMFEKRTSFTDSLFYDISAWTLPLAFGLSYEELDKGAFSSNLLGKKIEEEAFPAGKLTGPEDRYAYVFESYGYYAPRAVHTLLKKGLRVKVATKRFNGPNEKIFLPGSILIPVQNQKLAPSVLHTLLQEISQSDGIDIYGISTGFSTEGVDLGSSSFRPLEQPKICLLVGDGVSSYEAGEVWHLFDQRFGIPLTKISISHFGRADLAQYTTLIMTSGNYGELGESGTEKIKNWVEKGGNIIAVGSASRWLSAQQMAGLSFEKAGSPENGDHPPYARRNQDFGAQVIGGAIFSATMDLGHPISYGYEFDNLPVFKNSTTFIESSNSKYAYPIRFDNNPLLAGYISKQNEALLAEKAYVGIFNKGRGKIIVFSDDPNFRAFWFGTNKLFLNAIFFADIMRG